MPLFSSGKLNFTKSDGTHYSVEKNFNANSAHEATTMRQEIINREKDKGNRYTGGGSAKKYN